MIKKFLLLISLITPLCSYGLSGIKFLDDKKRHSVDYQLDPYYSQVAYNIDFKNPEIMPPEKEAGLYFYLLKHFFDIRSFRLEASINPLPILGVYLKSNQRDFYDSTSFGEFNIINAITEGFPEPGAISLFLGDRVYLGNEELGITGAGVGSIAI